MRNFRDMIGQIFRSRPLKRARTPHRAKDLRFFWFLLSHQATLGIAPVHDNLISTDKQHLPIHAISGVQCSTPSDFVRCQKFVGIFLSFFLPAPANRHPTPGNLRPPGARRQFILSDLGYAYYVFQLPVTSNQAVNSAPIKPMADAKALRVITIATFPPAFGLAIAHGSLSHEPVPAVGLVPLFFSASFAIFLLSRHRKRAKSKQRQSDVEGTEAGASHETHHHGDDELTGLLPHAGYSSTHVAHPILVFLTDAILAAALMVVLVFTWIRTGSSSTAELAMLAAYTTIPLLINL